MTTLTKTTERSGIERVVCFRSRDFLEATLYLAGCMLVAVDVETIPHMPKSKKLQPFGMTVVSYTGLTPEGEVRSYAVQLTRQKSTLMAPPDNLEMVLTAIRKWNAMPVAKVLHNGVYDAAWFLRYGAPLANYAWDTMTLWWSRFPDLPKTLDVVSSVLLDDHRFWKSGRKEEDFMLHTLYAMEDTETTLLCALPMIRWLLNDSGMMRNYSDAHRRCLAGLKMSLLGVPFDMDKRAELGAQLEVERDSALAALRHLVFNPELNPNSPPQMKHLLYDLLGAKPRNAKGRELKRLGGTAKVSTGAVAMRAMRADHPIISRVITAIDKAKRPAKQISNVMSLSSPDGRFRTAYDGIGTTTTRFSSRRDAFGFGGNAQNIRKTYRKMMGADEDSFYFEIDFSAADDVFVSYESEEPKKIELVESGKDIHSFNASQVFFTNWTYEAVVQGKKEDDPRVVDPITGIRQITKKTTHGANYLMAGMTLLTSAGRDAIVAAAKHLGHGDAGHWSTDRLAEFCTWLDEKYRNYYRRFQRSGTNSFYVDLQSELNRTQSFTSIFGYRQKFSSDPADQSTLRACAASVGQANTAGRVNMAIDELVFGVRMLRFRDGDAPDRFDPALPVDEIQHGCSLRFQTHDSLSYMVRHTHPNWREGVRRILHVMSRPVVCKGREVRVGIEADVAWRWAENTVTVDGVPAIEKWLIESPFQAIKKESS